ncbi:MAG: methyltransferase domain-containing protein [Anaerolineae bacterium]|nr:methyltransferase domain-containing protein [Anaerolineae bacterium]
MTNHHEEQHLTNALWKIYRRPERPLPWAKNNGNLPWNDPDFSARMLREHLDQSHGAASRTDPERAAQLDWLWQKLALQSGSTVYDLTCGPGLYAVPLAQRGCQVTGVDFGPASVRYARELAAQKSVSASCEIIEQDICDADYAGADFDAALFLYGQLAVFPREEAQQLLKNVADALGENGRLVIELLNQERVDTKNSTWWYTDDTGLWGDAPFLHLGERFWNADEKRSTERFHILHLETGQLDEIILSDQTYAIEEMTAMLKTAGFSTVTAYKAWDGLPVYDAEEWVVYVAEKARG